MNPANLGDPAARRPQVPVLLPVAGGLAVLTCSTAMTGMIAGTTWLVDLTLAVAVIVVVGIVLRGLRRGARSPVLGALTTVVQLFVLLCFAVLFYTDDGIAGLLPGPRALGDLMALFDQSMEEIRVGTQPVPGTPALLCLMVLSIGTVAVLVDVLAVEARTPAVAGLPLLCLYAVPASLSDELLPWWTFALGAGVFALLLAADRALRHQQWRGRVGLTSTSGLRPTPPMVAVAGVAVVVALVAGSSITAVGTTGTLPGVGTTLSTSDQAWGLNPFTKLDGELNQPDQPVELFRVRGLPSDSVYLRAVTLSTFDPQKGWRVGIVGAGQRLTGPLQPPPGGTDRPGPTSRVFVQPVHWRDNWLPLFGTPSSVSGPDPRVWRWDPNLASAFAKAPSIPADYAEQAMLRQPSTEALRGAPAGTDGLRDPGAFTEIPRVDPSVARLAHRLTDTEPTAFDKARSIWLYLTSGEFSYSLAAPSDGVDPTRDFLFRNKEGFCEQFSSAMAVMLRLVGVPTRIGVGFTDGTPAAGYRSITTQDAHAWTEVYFRGLGWVPFDPTPLSGGRGVTPSYLATAQDVAPTNRTAGPTPTAPVPPKSRTPLKRDQQEATPAAAAPARQEQRWWPPLAAAVTWAAPGGALLAVGVLGGLAVLGTVTLLLVLRRPRSARPGRERR